MDQRFDSFHQHVYARERYFQSKLTEIATLALKDDNLASRACKQETDLLTRELDDHLQAALKFSCPHLAKAGYTFGPDAEAIVETLNACKALLRSVGEQPQAYLDSLLPRSYAAAQSTPVEASADPGIFDGIVFVLKNIRLRRCAAPLPGGS